MALRGDDEVDEAILAYMAAARPVQDLLRQLLTQVAGHALALMTRRHQASRSGGSMRMAQTAADRAADQVRALKVPAAAAHHHFHLDRTAEAIRWSMRAAEQCSAADAADGERDALMRALKAASEHLRATTRKLPGFELIDFTQACCAAHVPPGLLAHRDRDLGLKEERNGGLFNMGTGIRCS